MWLSSYWTFTSFKRGITPSVYSHKHQLMVLCEKALKLHSPRLDITSHAACEQKEGLM